jgi:hypothetical protein
LANNSQVPLTTLFGTRSLFFELHWREENLFQINTPLENTEQLSLPLWFRPILFAGINLTFGNPRLPPGAIHIQPLQGCADSKISLSENPALKALLK